jgi:hypothetical protein
MKLRDLPAADLAALEREAERFDNSPLEAVFQEVIQNDIARILNALKAKSTPLEDVRYNQGELAQATRDILICEGLRGKIQREIDARRKETP